MKYQIDDIEVFYFNKKRENGNLWIKSPDVISFENGIDQCILSNRKKMYLYGKLSEEFKKEYKEFEKEIEYGQVIAFPTNN
jgi:hypothetical protein